jgi:hypothetical protein
VKLTSIQRAIATAVVSSSVLVAGVAGAAVAAADNPQLERMCLGEAFDEDCQTGPPSGTTDGHSPAAGTADLAAANMAAALYQDVEQAEAAGYVSTLDTLGCFEDAQRGGMGLHYANEALMDTSLDPTAPEALLYELDYRGDIASLVAHEYIVPVDAWTGTAPPRLFGRDFHQHPVLPLWILHTWIWKDNPAGVFADFNPRVRPCPDGVPVFGEETR